MANLLNTVRCKESIYTNEDFSIHTPPKNIRNKVELKNNLKLIEVEITNQFNN